ncbi:MAG: hypothetical protein LBL66_00965 [Clostridiales bacterium]|jgi:L-fucose isomerase-like protein|nr:hypothetical protein [Clostridiales bacterium]
MDKSKNMAEIKNKITFALFFGNRGFFPGGLIAGARKEVAEAVKRAGYDYIMTDESETRYGAVETVAEGEKYAAFLKKNEGKYDGVILCLPNFGDENGAAAALKECGKPILLHACSDRTGKMDFANRRDSMCGKIAMANVLRQHKIKFTHFRPFTADAASPEFLGHIERFAQICRIVRGMKSFTVAAVGARTTAFKTVRCDEIALQNNGVNVETIDMSDFFSRMREIDGARLPDKKKALLATAVFSGYPEVKLDNIARVGLALDDIITEYRAGAAAVRCWDELQKQFGVTPCAAFGEMIGRGIPAACESDITNAVAMRAVMLAADAPAMMLDINNNYDGEQDKAVLFHCGPVPLALMKGKGRIEEHLMFEKTYGGGCGVGINKGEIGEYDVTYAGARTENGKIHMYVGNARLTGDKLDGAFFGVGAVMETERMQDLLDHIVDNGFRHHTCLVKGHYAGSVGEALSKYLGYEVAVF